MTSGLRYSINSLVNSLAGKLIVILGILIVLGSGSFWYLSEQSDKNHIMDNSILFLASLSEMMKRSIRQDMMTVQRVHIQKTLEYISGSESISRIILFNSEGKVVHASDRKEIGMLAEKEAPACAGCHQYRAVPKGSLPQENQWTVSEDENKNRTLSYVEPIYNASDCFTASCHVHKKNQRVLGILMTDFSLSPVDEMIEDNMKNNSFIALVFLILSTSVLYIVLWRFVLRPVKALSKGMERVSKGDLAQKVTVLTDDEIGRLANTFNEMTGELSIARRRMVKWAESLEEEVLKKTEEIRRTQDKLIQAEKLAALGRMTADVAHEIRNPLTVLGGFGRRLEKIVSGQKEKEYTRLIVSEAERLEHILRDVLNFSRKAKLRMEKTDLSEIVRKSIKTCSGLFDEHSIGVIERYETGHHVLIDDREVRQAVMNLVSNAVDAMQKGGALTVRICNEEANCLTYIAVHISDTGCGIRQEDPALIFEPFNTTKEIGKGTGLGLSISRKIMEEHGGFIMAKNNNDGPGTTVSLYFPYQSDEEAAKTPCWEFMQCRRNVNSEEKCPAYPNFGRVCWAVAGTFCQGKVQGTFAQKSASCKECVFYRSIVTTS